MNKIYYTNIVSQLVEWRGLKILSFLILCSLMLLMMGGVGWAFQPNCSTNYADYIVVDEFNDTNGVELTSHAPTGGSKNNDTTGYYQYAAGQGNQKIQNNTALFAGNDKMYGLRFKDVGTQNITVEFNIKNGDAQQSNVYLSLHGDTDSFAGCRWGTISDLSVIRHVNGGAADVDNTLLGSDYQRIVMLGDQYGNCWYTIYYQNGSQQYKSAQMADTSTVNQKNAIDFRSQNSQMTYGENLTVYFGNTCPQAASDTTPPYWSKADTNISTSSLFINDNIAFNVTWTDETALGTAILGFDEGDGNWKNISTITMSGTTYNAAHGRTLNRTGVIQWQFFGSDSSSNGNKSGVYSATVYNITKIGNLVNYTNDRLTYIFSGNHTQVGFCSLNGNWTGSWLINETKATVGNVLFNFTSITFGTDKSYLWGLNCSSSVDSIKSSNVTFQTKNNSNNPSWSNNITNFTALKINETGLFSIDWNASSAMVNYTFTVDYGDGLLRNISSGSLTGTSNTSNIAVAMNYSAGTLFRYQWHVRDSDNLGNSTPIWTLNVSNTLPTISSTIPNNNWRDSINLSANFTITDADAQTLTYRLYINNVSVQSYNSLPGTGRLNQTDGVNGTTYWWFVSIEDGNGKVSGFDSVNSSERKYTIDTQSPYYQQATPQTTPAFFSIANNTILSTLKTNLTIQEVCKDDSMLLRCIINITNQSGYVKVSWDTGNFTGTVKSYTFNNLTDLTGYPDGNYTYIREAEDSHTDKSISNYDVIAYAPLSSYDKNKDSSGITKTSSLLKDEKIRLKVKTDKNIEFNLTIINDLKNDLQDFQVDKDKDRYNWTLRFKLKKAMSITWKIETIEKVRMLSNSSYPGHFVIPHHWGDFAVVGNTNPITYAIYRAGDSWYVQMDFNEDTLSFYSFGGLNYNRDQFNYVLDSTLPSLNSPVPVTGTNSTKTSISVNATIIDSNPASCWLRHNQTGTFGVNQTQTYTNGNVCNFNVNFPDGRYVWGLFANDSADNENFTANSTITIDSTAPVVSVLTANNTVHATITNNFTVTYSITDFVGITNCSFRFPSNVLNQTAYNLPLSTNNTFNVKIQNIQTNNYSVECYDRFNNYAVTSVYFVLTDVTAPNITSINTSSSKTVINITLETNEASNFTVSRDLSDSVTTFSLYYNKSFTGLNTGTTYNYNVTVYDSYGNKRTYSYSTATSVSVAEIVTTGGGGGGDVTTPQNVRKQESNGCSTTVEPKELIFAQDDNIITIKVINNNPYDLQPMPRITGDILKYVAIQQQFVTLAGIGSFQEVSIKVDYNENIAKDLYGEIVLDDPRCSPIAQIPITILATGKKKANLLEKFYDQAIVAVKAFGEIQVKPILKEAYRIPMTEQKVNPKVYLLTTSLTLLSFLFAFGFNLLKSIWLNAGLALVTSLVTSGVVTLLFKG